MRDQPCISVNACESVIESYAHYVPTLISVLSCTIAEAEFQVLLTVAGSISVELSRFHQQCWLSSRNSWKSPYALRHVKQLYAEMPSCGVLAKVRFPPLNQINVEWFGIGANIMTEKFRTANGAGDHWNMQKDLLWCPLESEGSVAACYLLVRST